MLQLTAERQDLESIALCWDNYRLSATIFSTILFPLDRVSNIICSISRLFMTGLYIYNSMVQEREMESMLC